MEGVIATHPALADRIEIHRIDWQRPRPALVDLLGSANQSCPVLILSDSGEDCDSVQSAGEVFFINDKDVILRALARRHGLPEAHP